MIRDAMKRMKDKSDLFLSKPSEGNDFVTSPKIFVSGGRWFGGDVRGISRIHIVTYATDYCFAGGGCDDGIAALIAGIAIATNDKGIVSRRKDRGDGSEYIRLARPAWETIDTGTDGSIRKSITGGVATRDGITAGEIGTTLDDRIGIQGGILLENVER